MKAFLLSPPTLSSAVESKGKGRGGRGRRGKSASPGRLHLQGSSIHRLLEKWGRKRERRKREGKKREFLIVGDAFYTGSKGASSTFPSRRSGLENGNEKGEKKFKA